jgi:hypothetical protein
MQPESLAMARNLAATCSVLAYQSSVLITFRRTKTLRTEKKIQQKKLFLHPRGTRGMFDGFALSLGLFCLVQK